MKNKFELTVPIKRYFQLILVIGGGTLVMGIVLLIAIFKLILENGFSFKQDMIGFLVIFPLFFLYSMWLVFGYEKIIIDNETIELIKSNLIITKRTKINLLDIKSVKKKEKIFSSEKWIDRIRERIRELQKAFPFWIRMGQLELQTKTNKITFFNGLSYYQIPKIRKRIENEIKKRTHNNLYTP